MEVTGRARIQSGSGGAEHYDPVNAMLYNYDDPHNIIQESAFRVAPGATKEQAIACREKIAELAERALDHLMTP